MTGNELNLLTVSADVKYYSPSGTRDTENPSSSTSRNSEEKWSSVGQEAMNLFWKSMKRQTSQGALKVYHWSAFWKQKEGRTIVSCFRSFCSIFVQRNYRKRLPTVEKTGKHDYFRFGLNNFANMYECSSCLRII